MASGYIGYVRTGTDGKSEPPTPFVIHVLQPPGSTNEVLTGSDGRIWQRSGLTVFATIEEAEEDAWQRLAKDGHEHAQEAIRIRAEIRKKYPHIR